MENMEKTLCTVIMDGETHTSEDFVAILSKDNGDAGIYYDTDVLTLGMSLKVIAKEFVRCLQNCPPEEQEQIQAILGESLFGDVNDDFFNSPDNKETQLEGNEVNA